ncbi:hypothetical protein [Streptacidiphilus anmyonensis]|uniref:hypothetical protein n=1 Tax=Streptacidiphilus anmyonensis TaxID=405782 RepID=UPI0005A845BD|nr:hypothetical protein [Streptacidiphilus anmyonensis]
MAGRAAGRVAVAASVAAVVALGTTACGGSDSTSKLDSWAKSVCGGIATPIKTVADAKADTGRIVQGESPTDLQKRLADDMGQLATGNQQIAQAVQAAGAPATNGGSQTQADAVSELNQAAGGYTKVQQTVKALPVNDQARFAAGLRGVSDQIGQLSTQSSAALQTLQTGDLGAALNRQPGCAAPSGSPTDGGSGTSAASPDASGSASSSAPTSSASASASGTAKGSAKPSGTSSAKASASASS